MKLETLEEYENLAIQCVNITEKTAIACHKWIGKGDERGADQAAVTEMRHNLNQLNIHGKIVIGEGERDKAPMLYIGEEVGTSRGFEVDIAVDPLEGTTICATANEGSISVLAMGPKDSILHAPDIYMEKIAIGMNLPEYIIDLDNSPKENLSNLALAKSCDISDLTVVILNRSRHEELISKVRETGARVRLISDGDILPILETSLNNNIDIYMGIGGAPEGVLAAAALRAIGGQMMGRLIFSDQDEKNRATKMGIKDFSKKYIIEELVKKDAIFSATSITRNSLLDAINITKNGSFITNSLLTISCDKSFRLIKRQ